MTVAGAHFEDADGSLRRTKYPIRRTYYLSFQVVGLS